MVIGARSMPTIDAMPVDRLKARTLAPGSFPLMSNPNFGHKLAELHPVPVPIFRLFEWSSENSPQEGGSDVLSFQLGGRMPRSGSFKKAPALLETFAPSTDQLRAIFESLVLATMPAPMKSPAVSPLMEIAPLFLERSLPHHRNFLTT